MVDGGGIMLRKVTREELAEIISRRTPGEQLDLHETLLENMDLSGWDLHNINFNKSDIRNVNLDKANMSYLKADNALFGGSTFRGTNLSGAYLHSADLRGCDLTGADIRGADLFASALERADLTDIRTDRDTKHYHLYCPEKGPFIGWKVCFGRRIVQLLVPEDARRISGTTNEVKCDKAKVLTIKSVDYRESYKEAHSYVDEDFVYRTGEMVYADNFNPDRFLDSAGGIHIWLTREEAIAYLG
ncbi:pentapeptide repeat-containing protein [Extibacter muris]|uniref:pentapeptide repeat-containing protein n=2 Tax=Extibacter muris TaxID=1796622 RepID=UPI00210BE3C6|nr:pentapeptide repeat-containing protein [Extibacter muris]